MLYHGSSLPMWKLCLHGGLKVLGFIAFICLGGVLCMSENWVGLGILILMLTAYKILKMSGHTEGICPYCGARIAANGVWTVLCRNCYQRSYVRHSLLLEEKL